MLATDSALIDRGVPMGWFFVAPTAQLAPGMVEPLSMFGRELILWCDQRGAPRLHSAHCPHMGAHLGHGGTVEQDVIVCPFHGWRFDGLGEEVRAARAASGRGRACLSAYPLRVVAETFLMAWFHPHAESPRFDLTLAGKLSELCSPAFSDWHVASTSTIRSAVQEMAENGVDLAHFPIVHRGTVARAPALREYTTNGADSFAHLVHRRRIGDVEIEVPVEVWCCGPGLGLVHARIDIDGLLVEGWTLVCTQPIDARQARLRLFSKVPRQGRTPNEISMLLDLVSRTMLEEIAEDQRIWENKRFVQRPPLSGVDGPIIQFRRWFEQFYAADDGVAVCSGAVS